MQERILITGKINTKVKTILQKASIALFAIAAIISIGLAIPEKNTYYSRYSGHWYYTVYGWERIFYFAEDTKYFIWFLFGALCLVGSIIFGIIYIANRNCELQITENSVKGKAMFGKEVVLPLDMVSAYSTTKLLSGIAVATASGITKFALIENYKEIGQVLAQKITERQQVPATPVAPVQAPSSNVALDDLMKLKSLLDSGIITQEEFDAKKKQLLGL